MNDLTHFSLFTGIGGIDLAAEWAGFETVGQVEKNEFCQQVLTKHWPDVPGWSDVRDVTKKSFREKIGEREIHLLSGGFPCQPFSTAGKRKGKEDDRDLWPEMSRVIQEIRPSWVLGENVANYTNMGLDRTLSDLESEGYNTKTFEIPAIAIGAAHQRMRVFIVAYSDHKQKRPHGRKNGRMGGLREQFEEWKENFANTVKKGLQGRGLQLSTAYQDEKNQRIWETESPVCRGNDGFPDRVDRIKSLGNAVVPQQVYPILQGIAEIEKVA